MSEGSLLEQEGWLRHQEKFPSEAAQTGRCE